MAAATDGFLRPFSRFVSTPLMGPLSTMTPGPTYDSGIVSSASGSRPSGWITGVIFRPNCLANSKSRWSCAGTAMIAPVP